MGFLPAPVAIMHPVRLSGWKYKGSHGLHPGEHMLAVDGRGAWAGARLVCWWGQLYTKANRIMEAVLRAGVFGSRGMCVRPGITVVPVTGAFLANRLPRSTTMTECMPRSVLLRNNRGHVTNCVPCKPSVFVMTSYDNNALKSAILGSTLVGLDTCTVIGYDAVETTGLCYTSCRHQGHLAIPGCVSPYLRRLCNQICRIKQFLTHSPKAGSKGESVRMGVHQPRVMQDSTFSHSPYITNHLATHSSLVIHQSLIAACVPAAGHEHDALLTTSPDKSQLPVATLRPHSHTR